MFRASRYRWSPHKTQEQQFQRLCGASGSVYNELLPERIESYKPFNGGPALKSGASRSEFLTCRLLRDTDLLGTPTR